VNGDVILHGSTTRTIITGERNAVYRYRGCLILYSLARNGGEHREARLLLGGFGCGVHVVKALVEDIPRVE